MKYYLIYTSLSFAPGLYLGTKANIVIYVIKTYEIDWFLSMIKKYHTWPPV